jgi:hypothetical protein
MEAVCSSYTMVHRALLYTWPTTTSSRLWGTQISFRIYYFYRPICWSLIHVVSLIQIYVSASINLNSSYMCNVLETHLLFSMQWNPVILYITVSPPLGIFLTSWVSRDKESVRARGVTFCSILCYPQTTKMEVWLLLAGCPPLITNF